MQLSKSVPGSVLGPIADLERISKPPFERLASNLRSVLIKEVISYGMYKEG
jgi:hypothetical protein